MDQSIGDQSIYNGDRIIKLKMLISLSSNIRIDPTKCLYEMQLNTYAMVPEFKSFEQCNHDKIDVTLILVVKSVKR